MQSCNFTQNRLSFPIEFRLYPALLGQPTSFVQYFLSLLLFFPSTFPLYPLLPPTHRFCWISQNNVSNKKRPVTNEKGQNALFRFLFCLFYAQFLLVHIRYFWYIFSFSQQMNSEIGMRYRIYSCKWTINIFPKANCSSASCWVFDVRIER